MQDLQFSNSLENFPNLRGAVLGLLFKVEIQELVEIAWKIALFNICVDVKVVEPTVFEIFLKN